MFLEIHELRKSFGAGENRTEVLKGLDFSVEKGEICVLLGPSGSGKSTLLNIIGGIDEADGGYISIDGEKMEEMKEKALTEYRRRHLGYVFQMYNLIPNLNVKENIELLLKILEEAEFNQEWINEYKQDMINYLKEKHKTNNLFPVQFAQDILLVLKQIDNKEENLKRVLSIKCFGDSKYFERNIEHILIRIIKTYLLEKAEEYRYLIRSRNIKISRNL